MDNFSEPIKQIFIAVKKDSFLCDGIDIYYIDNPPQIIHKNKIYELKPINEVRKKSKKKKS